MSEGGESRSGGLFDSLARFGQSLLSAVQTRLLLVADELEEQGALVARMAILWALAGICLLSAVVIAALLLIVLFWESRVAVLSGMLAVLAVIGVVAWAKAKAIARARPRAFSDVLQELAEDREAIARRRSTP